MVEAHRVDAVEARHVVLVGCVVSMPGDYIKRRMVEARRPEPAEELGDDFKFAFAVIEGGDRGEKVARVRQAIGSNRTEIGQSKWLAVIFADVATRVALEEVDPELDAARNRRQLSGLDLKNAAFGGEAKPSLLRQDQHLAIGVVKETVSHRGGRGVDVNSQAHLRRRVAIAADCDHAL